MLNYTLAMINQKDYVLILKNWIKPLTFVSGEQNAFVSIDKSRQYLQFISESNFFELPRTGQMAMLEAINEVFCFRSLSGLFPNK